ncbi:MULTISPECIES: VOC family protein [unclassified Streptomyces]|uniref:VOC family protein n=1 Tax=unclassified Streptomyces TaxID=2593676 RepID=UPI0019088946|nr:VOC family protein [Streptomyces sp. HSG2]
MITTDFTPGAVCWIDLGTPDVPAAASFYRAVFGWEFESMGEEDRPEGGMFRKDGRLVGGLGTHSEEGERPTWMLYYSVRDADATTRDVERAGGTVRVAPRDLGEWGRMAQYTDPSGGRFAVWQPGTGAGFELVDKPGSLGWTELYTPDVEASKDFYRAVFDWQYGDMPLPGGQGNYILVTPAGLSRERTQGGFILLPPQYLTLSGGRPYWHPVFSHEDCDAAVAAVVANGGTVQMGPQEAGGVGRMAVCLDPWGADFVLLTPAGPASG